MTLSEVNDLARGMREQDRIARSRLWAAEWLRREKAPDRSSFMMEDEPPPEMSPSDFAEIYKELTSRDTTQQ